MAENTFTLPPADAKPENETREAIKNMSGHQSFEELGKVVPEQTALPGMDTGEAPKKRGRKPGSTNKPKTPTAEIDPLLSDKRYQQAVERMAAFGSSQAIETAFKVTGAPLEAEEKERVNDLTYVASKRYNLDPSRSPVLMAIYTIILLAQLVLVRVAGTTSGEMWKQFQGLFGKKEEEKTDE